MWVINVKKQPPKLRNCSIFRNKVKESDEQFDAYIQVKAGGLNIILQNGIKQPINTYKKLNIDNDAKNYKYYFLINLIFN